MKDHEDSLIIVSAWMVILFIVIIYAILIGDTNSQSKPEYEICFEICEGIVFDGDYVVAGSWKNNGSCFCKVYEHKFDIWVKGGDFGYYNNFSDPENILEWREVDYDPWWDSGEISKRILKRN